MAQGQMLCPHPDDKVHVAQQEREGAGQFVVKCSKSGVTPHVVQDDTKLGATWSFPRMFSPDSTQACEAPNHVLTSIDETEPVHYE